MIFIYFSRLIIHVVFIQIELVCINNDTRSTEGSIAIQQSSTDGEENLQLGLNTQEPTVDGNDTIDQVTTSISSWDLKCYHWTISGSTVGAMGFFIFTCIVMTTGILIVCFTSPKSHGQKCKFSISQTATNPIEYNYGPRSVAVGDFNNDTWIDMVVANSIVNNIGIYFGYENGTFVKQIEYSTGLGSNPYMVAVGNLNNDSRLDIAVANFGTNTIRIFLGYGNGSFVNQLDLSTNTSRPISISLVDFNNDTVLDIVTVNFGTNSISIFYGYENGMFSNPTMYSTGYDSLSYALAVGDFNNDNYIDIAIANYGTNNIGLFLNAKNGTVEKQITISTGYGSHPISIAVGNFNDDTLVDIAVANHGTNTIGIYLSNGNGTFTNQMQYSINSGSPYSIGVGDFNQDNHLDIFIITIGANNTGLLLGYGNGSFSDARMNSTGSTSSISFAICDFNKDKRLDVIVVNNETNSMDILEGYFEGFSLSKYYSTGYSPMTVALGDFNNDGKLDLVAANYYNNSISVLLGNGNGSFAKQKTYSTGASPYGVAVNNFNNDSYLDLAVANYDDGSVSIFLGYGNGSFAKQKKYTTGYYPQSLAAGDLNNDGLLDLVVANYGSLYVSVLLGYSNGSFANQMKYITSTYSY
ncbi:unnamed protein product, partial [Adineta steineri]